LEKDGPTWNASLTPQKNRPPRILQRCRALLQRFPRPLERHQEYRVLNVSAGRNNRGRIVGPALPPAFRGPHHARNRLKIDDLAPGALDANAHAKLAVQLLEAWVAHRAAEGGTEHANDAGFRRFVPGIAHVPARTQAPRLQGSVETQEQDVS